MSKGNGFVHLWVIGAILALAMPAVALAQEDLQARQILDLAGRQQGLCVHLGSGQPQSPGLTAALAAGSKMLVHGVAIDDLAAERARKAIEARALLGQAIVERLPLDPLPHLRDLANLIVIEDFDALAAKGLKLSEVQRILAPGGILCMFRDGQWTKTQKPRPKEMDDWTHPTHGPDGNRVSDDRIVQFPVGLRWQDGVPMNFNLWAACRGWVIADGRCFTLSTTELENLAPASFGKHKQEEYVTARDAFNGLPLWKVNCKTTNDGKYLNAWNPAPLVTDGRRVYVYKEDGLTGLDAATGSVAATYAVKYPTSRLVLSQNVLLSAGWEAKEEGKDPGPQTLWAPWVSKTQVGAVEAFDTRTGKPRWSLPVAAQEILAADGIAYLLLQTGNPAQEQRVVAVDIQSGKQRWSVPHSQFAPEPGLHLGCAGHRVLVVARVRAKAISVLSSDDGRVLWEIKPTGQFWTPMVDGLVWHGNTKYAPKTGEIKGKLPAGIDSPVCTPAAVVGNYVTASRSCNYLEFPAADAGKPKRVNRITYTGARGGCIEGSVPACGMFYTGQNNCRCAPGQVQGFVAFGPSGDLPAEADFEQARPVEKGPAFGAVKPSSASDRDWPMFRHDAVRSGAVKGRLPPQLKPLWQTDVCRAAEGPLAETWKSKLTACLSAPVVAEGRVFAAACDAGQIVALDAATGRPAWRFTAGGRIDTPPTIYQGLCLFGCHDGWIYALRAEDGKLAWRTRIAPWERRMVAFGQIESVWPAIGSVLIYDNVVYATAGRTGGSDGGIAVCALQPHDGRQLWAKSVVPAPPRVNDMLAMSDGKLALHQVRIDPKTGKDEVAKDAKSEALDGTMDGTWTRLGTRRSGNLTIGRAKAEMFVWNDATIFGYDHPSRCCYAIEPAKTAGSEKDKLTGKDYVWRQPLPANHQAEAMALTADAIILAGRVWDAKTERLNGALWSVSLADGKKTFETDLDVPPSFQGIAVANDRVVVTLQNGRVVCYGN